MKQCKKCLIGKSLEQFHKNSSRKDGHMGICKDCNSARMRAWSKQNPKRKHGLGQHGYEILFASQGNVCASCKTAKGPFHVDHDHKCCNKVYSCGKCVRGILCNKCNVALAMVNDSEERLQQLVSYLGRVT